MPKMSDSTGSSAIFIPLVGASGSGGELILGNGATMTLIPVMRSSGTMKILGHSAMNLLKPVLQSHASTDEILGTSALYLKVVKSGARQGAAAMVAPYNHLWLGL